MQNSLQIELLGRFSLTYRGEPVRDVSSLRMQSLLAYLVLNPGPHNRQHLAFLFWPNSTEAQARTNLRRELHHLRRILPDADSFLLAKTNVVAWQPDSPYTLDVRAFENAAASGSQLERASSPTGARERLSAAAGAYRGELLPGCYDPWLLAERERLAQLFAAALDRLVRLHEAELDWPIAITWAQRLLQHDPLREATYRDLIRLHSLNHDRSSALRIYHNCTTILQRELGVEPEAATRALYQQLLTSGDELPAPSVPAAAASARPPLIGRRQEWQIWESAWRAAATGQARVLCLVGEAGIGKSRLAEEMLYAASRQGAATAWARCYAAVGELAFAPVAQWLNTPSLRSSRAGLEPVWLAELARLLPEIQIQRPELPTPQPLTENWQRLRLFEALARTTLAGRRPLLLVLDDLHWCDADTLAWLQYLLRFDTAAQLLILITVRIEELPMAAAVQRWLAALRQAGQLIEVGLGALDATETAALAAQLIGRTPNADFAALIFQETEGNPLFVVETVRTSQAERPQVFAVGGAEARPTAASTQANSALPARIHTVIAARLAQLPQSARDLAGLAATIGRAFTFAVLAAASERDEDGVARDLDILWTRLLVRERGGEIYDFSHDKIREVAYAQASAGHRRLLHRRIAQALTQVHAGDLDAVCRQVAAHYDLAGLPDQAISFYQRAAAVAQALYANEEAASLLNRALTALSSLPSSLERDQRELTLQTALGVPLVALKGYSAPEVRLVYTRAHKLCQHLGRPPEAPVLRALALISIVRSEFIDARAFGEQLRQMAEENQDTILNVEAHYVLGVSQFWLADFRAARAHLELALASYDPSRRSEHIALYAQDPAVVCLVRLAYVLWYLGYPAQAREKCEAALALGRKVGHPFSLAYALNFAAWYASDQRDLAMTRELVIATQALAAEQGFGLWAKMSGILGGWVRSEQGKAKAGIEQIRSGLDEYRQNGASLGHTYYLALLAGAYLRQGDFGQGLQALDAALALADQGEERWYVAELHRQRGELMLRAGADAAEVEHWYREAHAIAQQQQALPFELRAAASLCRLWQSQGRQQQGRQLLQETYQKFTEGFDTPDLVEARSQLQALA